MTNAPRVARTVRLTLVGGLVAAVMAAAAPASQAVEVPTFPGSLPDSNSAVTVSGRGPLAGFAVHVSQTTNLASQGISLSWSWPGLRTVSGYTVGFNSAVGSVTQAYLGNYVQVMQCWGDPVTDATSTDPAVQANYVADNPGPPREQCEYGGTAEGDPVNGLTTPIQNSRSAGAAVAPGAARYYGDETAYATSASSSYTDYPEVPFKAVDGTSVANSFATQNGNRGWANPYFGKNSTNEISVAPVFPDGTGGATFQAQNSVDAPGLGCGAENATNTGLTKCWLVVVPRPALTAADGTALKPGSTAVATNPKFHTVYSSPLASTLWANRIAIPLTFQPTLDACAGASSTYLTVGSALPQNALLSWQAALCRGGGSTGYSYIYTPDSIARQDIASGSDSMRLVSDPVPPDQVFDPVTYAPLTVSGISVSYVFEPSNTEFSLPEVSIKLNPRLVAKALTQSYQDVNPYRINPIGQGTPPPSSYAWLANNPATLWQDPEFWALNPDILTKYPELQDGTGYNTGYGSNGYLQVSGFGSDGYAAVWKWLLADQDTRDFLAGEKDHWGMSVDPYYSTNASLNPTGTAFDPTALDYFPSLDQWQGDPRGSYHACVNQDRVPGQPDVGTVDIAPSATSFANVAKDIVRVDRLSKANLYNCPDTNGQGLVAPDSPVGWLPGSPQVVPGQRKMLGLTDTASSAQYGVVTAELRNAHGDYVAPTVASMQAAASHLTYTGGVTGVGQPDRATDDPAAYPLTLVTYAAVQTNKLDDPACAAYAGLLTYAAGQGQVTGADVGQLPFGYAPLSAAQQQQTSAAAATVAACAKLPRDDEGGTTPVGGDAGPAAPAAVPGGDAVANPDAPTDGTVASVAPGTTAAIPPVSLAATRGTTKPDPRVFAWVVPIALGVGFLSLLVAPVAGLRRRRPAPESADPAD